MIIDNISKYLEYKGLSVSFVEKEIGFSNGTLSKPIKENKTIKTNTLEKFLSHFGDLNPMWLITGEGDMLIESVSSEPQSVYAMRTDHLVPDVQQIPLFDDYEAIAGLTPVYLNKSDKKPNSYI